MDFRVAAKAFIVRDGKLLTMKRRADDPHKPGAVDIPGGRLEPGESPFEGLKREVKEEINGEIEIMQPLSVRYFTRQDGQTITLIIFLCKLLSEEIKLSYEHSEFSWVDLSAFDQIPEFFSEAITNYRYYAKN
jgi:8-oxo-dGTP pyrophosphatase MutT (NUDIX family)